jgi:hypothetical protein
MRRVADVPELDGAIRAANREVRPSGVSVPNPENLPAAGELASAGPSWTGCWMSAGFHTVTMLSPAPGLMPSLCPLASKLRRTPRPSHR